MILPSSNVPPSLQFPLYRSPCPEHDHSYTGLRRESYRLENISFPEPRSVPRRQRILSQRSDIINCRIMPEQQCRQCLLLSSHGRLHPLLLVIERQDACSRISKRGFQVKDILRLVFAGSSSRSELFSGLLELFACRLEFVCRVRQNLDGIFNLLPKHAIIV